MILEKKSNELIIKKPNGAIESVPLTPYFHLKYEKFDGDRIIIDMPDGRNITETFDEMIFNLTKGSQRIQSHPRDADLVSLSIISYIDTKNPQGFDTVFDTCLHDKEADINAIETMIRIYNGRIRVNDIGFIVDDLFIVDRKGQAHLVKEGRPVKFLCVVAKNARNVSEEILSKIIFLLNPNLDDDVFTRQLDQDTLEILRRNVQ